MKVLKGFGQGLQSGLMTFLMGVIVFSILAFIAAKYLGYM